MARKAGAVKSGIVKAGLVEPARHFGPRGIAALLVPVVRPVLRKRGASLAVLIEEWAAIVGAELAARSVPVKCVAGTLTLGCAGPDALELQHRAPSLIGRINLALGGAPITRLRFVDVPARLVAAPVTRPVARGDEVAVARDDLPEGPVGEALARLRRGLGRRPG